MKTEMSPTSEKSSSEVNKVALFTRLSFFAAMYASALAARVRDDPAELASFDPRFSFFKGGVAAIEGSRRVGAVGVSGLPGEEDEQLAERGIEAAGLDLPPETSK